MELLIIDKVAYGCGDMLPWQSHGMHTSAYFLTCINVLISNVPIRIWIYFQINNFEFYECLVCKINMIIWYNLTVRLVKIISMNPDI